MSDNTQGAAGEGGAAGGAGAAGQAGAAAGAAGAGGAAAAPWHGLTEPEAAAYVENKGWKTPADVVKSYQGAEKLIGRDPSTLIPLPRADDPAGARAVLAKLGLPESPDKYDFPKPTSGEVDATYEKWARDTFHKIGLTGDMAKQLTAAHNEFITNALAQREKDYTQRVEADKSALLAEWRGGHERMMNLAQTAAKSLGFSSEMVDAIEQAVGYAGTMKFFAQLGAKLGEDTFVSPDGKPRFNGALTPAEAKAEWDKMRLDPNTLAALKDVMHPAHKQVKEKQNELFKVMYPER